MKLHSLLIPFFMAVALCVTAPGQQTELAPPISVAIVLDASGSMGSKMQQVREVVAEVLKPANRLDEYAAIKATDRPVLLGGFVSGPDVIESFTFLQAKGRSALLDGIYLGVQQMRAARNARKVLLVISDGGDNSSRYTEAEIANAAREAGVRVYTVGVYEPIAGRGRTAEELSGPDLLARIAEHTGGRHFTVERGGNSPQISIEVSGALRARQ